MVRDKRGVIPPVPFFRCDLQREEGAAIPFVNGCRHLQCFIQPRLLEMVVHSSPPGIALCEQGTQENARSRHRPTTATTTQAISADVWRQDAFAKCRPHNRYEKQDQREPSRQKSTAHPTRHFQTTARNRVERN